MNASSRFAGLKKIIRTHAYFVISFHRNPDGDCLSNAVLWSRYLAGLGKRTLILSADPCPSQYRFILDDYLPARLRKTFRVFKEGTPLQKQVRFPFSRAVFLVLDSSNLSRLGPSSAAADLCPVTVNIDHHSDNARFGTVNHAVPSAAACSVIFYDFIRTVKEGLDRPAAELIYISLYSDTVGLTTGSTTARTRAVIAELLGRGIGLARLNRKLRARRFPNLRLMGRIFSRMDPPSGKVLWAYAALRDLSECGCCYQDLDGVIDEMAAVQDTTVVFLLKEIRKGRFKVSIRSRGRVNIKALAAHFGGGGHRNASGFQVDGPVKAAVRRIKREIRKLPGI